MHSMKEMYSREGVAEIQEMCPGGSRSSLTQRAPNEDRCGFQGGIGPMISAIDQQCRGGQGDSSQTRSCCDDISRGTRTAEFNVEFAIGGAKDKIPDEEDITSGQQQHKPSISKVTESLCRARETPTADETAKCTGHSRGEVNSEVRKILPR